MASVDKQHTYRSSDHSAHKACAWIRDISHTGGLELRDARHRLTAAGSSKHGTTMLVCILPASKGGGRGRADATSGAAAQGETGSR